MISKLHSLYLQLQSSLIKNCWFNYFDWHVIMLTQLTIINTNYYAITQYSQLMLNNQDQYNHVVLCLVQEFVKLLDQITIVQQVVNQLAMVHCWLFFTNLFQISSLYHIVSFINKQNHFLSEIHHPNIILIQLRLYIINFKSSSSKQIMNLTLLICFLLCSTAMSQNNLVVQDQGKVKVDIYYETLCPDSIKFILNSFKRAVQTKDFWQICELRLYPYGKANYTKEQNTQQNSTLINFKCQHGQRQCQGNTIQACLLKKHPLTTIVLPFIICMQNDTNKWQKTGNKCSQQVKINWDEIYQCATSQQGVDLMMEIAEKSEHLKPEYTHVPWIVVNGQRDMKSQVLMISDMVGYVCELYKGPVKIDACKR